MKDDVKPVADPKDFQSIGGPNFCIFYTTASADTEVGDLFTAAWWRKVIETKACEGRIHEGDLIRIRSADRGASFDFFAVVSGFRKDRSPTLLRWPIDPFARAKAEEKLPPAIPTTLVQACEVLGVALDASPEDIDRVGHALRVANHPDHARDESEREERVPLQANKRRD
jgi:hypothetical protein